MVGRTLNQYEILEPLGAGGMGEVYRAHDATLKREVAVKVLPEDLSTDEERLARLEREAQLLATLNHPNIEVIHGLEEADGVRFVVLELIEGESLAVKLSRGRFQMEKALAIGRQIAEALEAAHAKGIIHRDLKPANVMITPEGQAKVLDFGLAKSNKAEGAVSGGAVDLTESPTVAVATQAGVILGTAAYMSPEQARGKPLDKRTDIWSFGCVFYEMLTGSRPFWGETVTDVLAAIVEREPDWNAIPSSVPPLVQVILRRCLEKDAYRRLHDIADARIEVANAISDPEGDLMGMLGGAAAEELPAWRRALPWAVAALMALLAALLAAQTTFWPGADDGSGRVTRLPLTLPAGFSPIPLMEASFAVSPDGTHIAHVVDLDGGSSLFLRDSQELELLTVPGSDGAVSPFFSHDGRWLGFFADQKVWKVSVEGGSPVPICDAERLRGAAWGPDDTIVLAPDSYTGLFLISATGGQPEPLTSLDVERGEISHRWPAFLPGGRAIVFNIFMGGSFDDSLIAAHSLSTGETTILLEGGLDPFYSQSGHLIYGRAGTLFAVPFDPERLELTGSPEPVEDGVSVANEGPGTVEADVTLDGTMFYRPEVRTEHEVVAVDREGNEETLPSTRRSYGLSGPRFSPDGSSLVISQGDDIWLYDIERGVMSPFITHEASDGGPLWMPDGQTVIFHSNRSGNRDLYRVPADGSEEEIVVRAGQTWMVANSVCSDGQVLLYVGGGDIWALPLEEDAEPEIVLQNEADEGAAVFSSDCRWLAYSSAETGRYEVYVRPYDRPGRPVQISIGGGDEPAWGPDGREIFYRAEGYLMVVEVSAGDDFSAGLPEMLFEADYLSYGMHFPRMYDISPDGQRFVFFKQVSDPPVSDLVVVTNWFEELTRLVPREQ